MKIIPNIKLNLNLKKVAKIKNINEFEKVLILFLMLAKNSELAS